MDQRSQSAVFAAGVFATVIVTLSEVRTPGNVLGCGKQPSWEGLVMKRKTIARTLLRMLTRGPRTILVLAALGACFTTFAFGAADSGPCSRNAESRQLDYWLGDWTVKMAGAPDGATSKVELSLDKCLFVES